MSSVAWKIGVIADRVTSVLRFTRGAEDCSLICCTRVAFVAYSFAVLAKPGISPIIVHARRCHIMCSRDGFCGLPPQLLLGCWLHVVL